MHCACLTKLGLRLHATLTAWQQIQSIDLFYPGNELKLNLSTMATLGTEESGHCKEVAIVKMFKQESMYGLFVGWDKKKWPLAEVQLYHIFIAYFSLPSPVTTILLLSGDHAISFTGPLRGWYSYFSIWSSCVVSQILSFPETSETWMLFQQIN